MKLFLCFVFFTVGVGRLAAHDWQDGDIVFQRLTSSFGSSVEESTGSIWSHVGIFFYEGTKGQIIEAIPPKVTISSVESFLARCKNRYALKRLPLSVNRKGLIERAKTHLGKPYDRYFTLNETSSLYCSELVYDGLQAIGVSIPSHPMDFSQALPYWQNWFQNHPIPQGEPGVSPGSIYENQSSHLIFHFNQSSLQKSLFDSLYAP